MQAQGRPGAAARRVHVERQLRGLLVAHGDKCGEVRNPDAFACAATAADTAAIEDDDKEKLPVWYKQDWTRGQSEDALTKMNTTGAFFIRKQKLTDDDDEFPVFCISIWNGSKTCHFKLVPKEEYDMKVREPPSPLFLRTRVKINNKPQLHSPPLFSRCEI